MKFICISFIILLFFGCSNKINEGPVIKENSQELEMINVYKEAYKALDEGDPYFAAKKFLEAELLFPQSEWAPKAALMASYSYYVQGFYPNAISTLDRFFISYPNSKNIVYAHYLVAMCYYETIEDEKRDLQPILKAKKKFTYLIENFPDTEFAIDAKFKVDLINDILASKEMYIGRHYLKKKKWISSLNRFKNVIDNYEKTIFVEEALHRLVEIYYILGLKEESQKYANVLGYNYQSSDWYKKSYKVFNKNYEINNKKITNKDKRGVLEKFKKLFN